MIIMEKAFLFLSFSMIIYMLVTAYKISELKDRIKEFDTVLKISELKDRIKEFDTVLSEHKKGYRVSELGWQMECSRLHHELVVLRKKYYGYDDLLKKCLDTINNLLADREEAEKIILEIKEVSKVSE